MFDLFGNDSEEISVILQRLGLDSFGHLPDAEIVKRLVSPLDELERQILLIRYGLDENGDGNTLEETAERVNLTRERVRQIQQRAISKMRHATWDWERQFEIYEKGYRFEPHAELACADLHDIDLSGKKMQGANLRNANLQYANLIGTDLRGADLRGAHLFQARLYKTDLRGANLMGATLTITARLQSLGMLLDSELDDSVFENWGELIDKNNLNGATMPDGSIHD